jgi:hypothetical protein
MQIFTAAFASLLFFVQISTASPSGLPGTALPEPVDSVWDAPALAKTSTPSFVSHLKSPNAAAGGTTSGKGKKNTSDAAAADMYVICGGSDCDGECVGYLLTDIQPNTCYGSPGYSTAYIAQAGNTGLPYRIYASSDQCSNALGIPAVNTCYSTPAKDGFYRN